MQQVVGLVVTASEARDGCSGQMTIVLLRQYSIRGAAGSAADVFILHGVKKLHGPGCGLALLSLLTAASSERPCWR